MSVRPQLEKYYEYLCTSDGGWERLLRRNIVFLVHGRGYLLLKAHCGDDGAAGEWSVVDQSSIREQESQDGNVSPFMNRMVPKSLMKGIHITDKFKPLSHINKLPPWDMLG